VVAKVCDFGVSLNSAQHTGRIVDCPRTTSVLSFSLVFLLSSSSFPLSLPALSQSNSYGMMWSSVAGAGGPTEQALHRKGRCLLSGSHLLGAAHSTEVLWTHPLHVTYRGQGTLVSSCHRGQHTTTLINHHFFDCYVQIIGGERPVIPDDCPASYRDLIEACWAQDPGTHMCSSCI